MLMTNENIRLLPHDRLMEKTILRLIPRDIHPNHVTVLRFLMIPFVLYYLWIEDWPAALGLFLLAAFTDALDGSMARARKQITLWGTVADPVADKLLIGSVVVLFVAREVNPAFAGVIIFMELLILLGAFLKRRQGKVVSANEYGKIKMVLQVIGVTLLLLAKLFELDLAVPFAVGTLAIAIVFAMVSALTYGL
jgi:CDP-diacylglycerol--glycerol-3-phosphate 3-phosphatidyltransferase